MERGRERRAQAARLRRNGISPGLGHSQGGLWSYYCCGPAGEDLGVEAVRFEELPERWPELAERMEISGAELPHVNAAAGEFDWTPAAIDLVAELCRGDIERFQYEPTHQ